MSYILGEAIGWAGNILFVASYILVSTGKVSGEGKVFNFMNLGGAILFGIYAVFKSAAPVLILELFWGSIAIVALIRAYMK